MIRGLLSPSARGGVTLAILFAPAACRPPQSAPTEHKLVGSPAPDFDLVTQSGEPGRVSLGDARGKVAIVDFWATWCDPCKDSFPHYQVLAERHRGSLVMVGISTDEDPSGISDFARQTGAKFPLAWDEGGAVARSYDPETMPTAYILDKNGIVRFVHVGFHSGDEKQIEQEVQSLLR